MNDALASVNKELEAISHGLFLLSPDCIRALSTHETEEKIAEMRQAVDRAKQNLAAAQKS